MIHGTVMPAEVELSTSVQFAEGSASVMMFVPPGLAALFRRLVRMPVPESVSVVALAAPMVLVRPLPMTSVLLAAMKEQLPPKFRPRPTVWGLGELLVMLPTKVIGLPVSWKAPAPGLKTMFE